VLAYVLAKIEAGRDKEVFNEIKKLDGIRKANATYGIYDLHIEANFDTVEELDAFVFDRVRKIPGVKETVTMIASETLV
jgi:DNA-binding Lrp family transcriptional regulator